MPDPYTQLLEWRRVETTTRGLAKLPADFYDYTRRYLAETRTTFESELRSNPSSRKGELARQTYQRAHQLARDIVEARTRKLLELAFQAALGGARDVPNALPEDRALFDRFLESVRVHRSAVAPYLEAIVPVPAEPVVPGGTPPIPSAPTSAPVSLAAPVARAPGGPSESGPTPTYVRILKDSRPIAVGNETLELRREDVLSVTEETARLLVSTGVAERLRTGPPRTT